MVEYTFLDADMPDKVSSTLADVSAQSGLVSSKKLTKNEFYCLVLAAQGLTSLETSRVLSLAKETVESHRKKVRYKLKSKNMAHAVFEGVKYELKNRN